MRTRLCLPASPSTAPLFTCRPRGSSLWPPAKRFGLPPCDLKLLRIDLHRPAACSDRVAFSSAVLNGCRLEASLCRSVYQLIHHRHRQAGIVAPIRHLYCDNDAWPATLPSVLIGRRIALFVRKAHRPAGAFASPATLSAQTSSPRPWHVFSRFTFSARIRSSAARAVLRVPLPPGVPRSVVARLRAMTPLYRFRFPSLSAACRSSTLPHTIKLAAAFDRFTIVIRSNLGAVNRNLASDTSPSAINAVTLSVRSLSRTSTCATLKSGSLSYLKVNPTSDPAYASSCRARHSSCRSVPIPSIVPRAISPIEPPIAHSSSPSLF